MYKILKKLGECGCFAGVHCENAGVIDALISEAKKEGRLGPENHPLVRPDTMEAEAVHRLLVIAKEANAPDVYKRQLKKHYEGKPLLPKVFKDQNHLEEIKAVYVPFWLFDLDAAGRFRCV